MKKLIDMEKEYYKKQERAIQEGLKIRLVKNSCDCCKKEVNNEKNKYGYRDFYYVWDNKFLCEKCMIIQTFKDYPFIILLIIGFLLLDIITLPFRMFYKIFKKLCRINIYENIYKIQSKIFSFLWKYFDKISENYWGKYDSFKSSDFPKAQKYYEKYNKNYLIAHNFFRCYMYWEDKVRMEMKERHLKYRFCSWKKSINIIEPDLRWLV